MKRLLIVLVLVIALLPVPRTSGSLNFGASTDKLTCGSAASLDDLTTATYLVWYYPTAITATARMAQKGLAGTGYHYLLVLTTSGFIETSAERATTPASATASSNALTTNKWWFIGGVHNTGGANTDQKLFVGDLSATVTEVTSYSTQTVGSGSVVSNAAANQLIGNKSNDANPGLGRIAWAGIWNRVLTLGEIQDQQFNPHVTSGCVLFVHLGYNGTGTNADWSGNLNNCTVTGTTIANHVPLGRIMN